MVNATVTRKKLTDCLIIGGDPPIKNATKIQHATIGCATLIPGATTASLLSILAGVEEVPCSCIINGLNWQHIAKASFDHKRQSGALATIAPHFLS
jgi:hypothetical protein